MPTSRRVRRRREDRRLAMGIAAPAMTLLGLAFAFLGFMALFAGPTLLMAAPVLVFSMLFRQVALAGETQESPPPKP